MPAPFDDVPANRLFGFRLLARSGKRSEVRMTARAEHAQEEGIVHGGILAALGDTAAVYLYLPDLEAERSMTSIEFKLNFLRPATVDGGELIAVARPVKSGRRVAVVEAAISQDGRDVARGLYTYLFLERPRPDQSP